MEFGYKGYTESGKGVSGRVEAASAQDAARILRERGVFVRAVAPSAAAARPLAALQRSALWREFGALLGAGLAADAALSLLRRRASGAEAAAVARIEDGLVAGRGFAAAVSGAGIGAGEFEMAALSSAEAGSTLPKMLERLADDLEEKEQAAAAARAALAYPLFVLALGVAVAFGMALVVVPEMTSKLAESGIAMPASSRLIVGLCRFAAFVAAPLCAAAVAAAAAARFRARRDENFAVALDGAVARLPFSRYRVAVASHRFASVLGVLVAGGTALENALDLAAAATGKASIRAAARSAKARVKAGEAPGAAIAAMPEIGPALAPWVDVGEAGGCLPQMLEAAAKRQGALAARLLSTGLALLGPSLLVAVGAFVLALSLALLVPVLRLSTAAQPVF